MTDASTPKAPLGESSKEPRLREAVGETVADLLARKGYRQEDLARAVTDSRLGYWSRMGVSRFVGGSRSLTLEEALMLCAALGVPLIELLAGDGMVRVGPGEVVPLAALRDVALHGRVQDGRPDSALDVVELPGASVTEQIVAAMAADVAAERVSAETVAETARQQWSLSPEAELDRRLAETQVKLGGFFSARQLRGYRAHHIAVMVAELTTVMKFIQHTKSIDRGGSPR